MSICALFSVGFGWLGLLFDCVVCACFRLVLFGVFCLLLFVSAVLCLCLYVF